MRKFTVCFFLIALWQLQAYALNQQDQVLLKSVLKIVRSANLPAIPTTSLSLDQVQQQITQLSSLLQKIANDSETLQRILAVRDGLYTNDGEILRAILLTAAASKEERDALIAGLQYEKCKKWFWQCGLPPISWNKLKFKFQSTLKTDIDALEKKLMQLGVIKDDDFSGLDLRSLDPYEEQFQLFVQLEPLSGRFAEFIFRHYANQSSRNLNEKDLRHIFEKLITFLNDNEDGPLGFIRKATPRS